MSIASEILEHMAVAEVSEAVVVTPDSTVMYDDPLLQGLKGFTVEKLYEKLDEELIEILKIQKLAPEDCVKILGYLSELYRRGIHFHSTNPCLMNRHKSPYLPYERPQVVLEWWDSDICSSAMLSSIKLSLDKSLTTLKKIKAIQLASLKKPRVCEEINGLMDAILDANGNKISEFKDYLSPEHYRIIRAGRDISEIKEQDELLTCLKHMKSKLVYRI
jgi:hypothetical protein